MGVTEAYQEGLRILPVKIMRDGEFCDDMMRVILGNVRVPHKVGGDLRAQVNADFVGSKRLVRMYQQYGEELMESAIEEILNRSERRIRDLIRQMPEGVYEFEDFFDDSGPEPSRFGFTYRWRSRTVG